jgi:hypothetical protein
VRVRWTAGPSTALGSVEKTFPERVREPQVPPLRYPGFPVEVGALADLMRLSMRKAAHADMSGAA